MLVKICGITNLNDAAMALDAGADWIGLNLVAGPRRIELADAVQLLSHLKDPSCAVVLLSTDRPGPSQSLLTTLRDAGVRRLQLYGRAIPSVVDRLAREGLDAIVPWAVANEASLTAFDALLEACADRPPSYVLFDAGAPDGLGGTGQRADWEAIARARDARWPPMLLAGGLNPENVAQAIERLMPAGVDVSSGVEAKPGRKDPGKLRAFVAAARAAWKTYSN